MLMARPRRGGALTRGSLQAWEADPGLEGPRLGGGGAEPCSCLSSVSGRDWVEERQEGLRQRGT